MSEQSPALLCIVGATATGKTALAVALARRLGGEVVSCDSMQIYRGMNIGTAKPSLRERGGVRHHMIDVADPTESYSAARYAEEASRAVDDILSRGLIPIVAGGTGLYLQALTHGLHDIVEDDGQTRAYWTDVLNTKGPQALYDALLQVDPRTASRLSVSDIRRVMRALEVHTLTGVPLSERHAESQRRAPRYRASLLGLSLERAVLYARIEARVDDMMALGLLDEVRGLLARGVPADSTAMQAIGYKEMALVLSGVSTQEEATATVKQSTRRYAKRQVTWFTRRHDVYWLAADDENLLDKSTEIVGNFCLP